MPLTNHPTTPSPTSGAPSRVVQVPLARGRGYAKINEEDLIRLRSNGYVGKWFMNGNARGTEYVRLYHGDNNVHVAKLIMAPPKGYVVRYRNNDRKDLRRCNLVLQPRRAQLRELTEAGGTTT